MSKIIAIANQKGGVGKTTTTLNFGSCLAQHGKKVLLIDFDHQANLTLACGIDNADALEETIANPLAAAIEGRDDVKLPIYKYREKLDFVPSNVMLSNINLLLIQAMARESILKRVLETVRESYDYILIDCAPSLSVDLLNALTAANEVLIVSNAAKFSASGTEQLIKTIGKVKNSLNENLSIAGILFNRVDRRTNFNKDIIEMMRQMWGKNVNVFNTEIPTSIRVDESQAMGMSMDEYENTNNVAIQFSSFTEEYLRNQEEE